MLSFFFFFLVQYFHTLISWKKVETVDVFGYIHEDQRDFFQGTNTFTLHSMKVDDPRVWNVPPSRNILPMSIRHHSYFCLCLPNIRIRKIPRRERRPWVQRLSHWQQNSIETLKLTSPHRFKQHRNSC